METAQHRSMRRAQVRTKEFTTKYPYLGPIIYMASTTYFLAQIVVGWDWHPPYSVVNNVLSDLGNTTCGTYSGRYVCSNLHSIMNASFILLGLIMAVGSLLIYQEFTSLHAARRRGAFWGFALLGIGGLGAIVVGCFPENTIGYMHVSGAVAAIGIGNVGIFVLGWFLPFSRGRRDAMRWAAGISLVALVLFGSHRYFGLGAGTMERIAQYPQTIWLILIGLYISRDHYATRRSTRSMISDVQNA